MPFLFLQLSIMPAQATRSENNNTRRRISLYRIVAAVICFAAFLPVPTHSFTSLPNPAATSFGRQNRSTLPPSDCSAVYHKPSSQATVLLLKKNEKGGEKRQFKADDEGLFVEKNIPGLVFTTVLTLWHFWIGPALKPIILDMQK